MITPRFWLATLALLSFLTVSARNAGAADKDDSAYRELVARVNKGDSSIDFRALRLACLKAKNCDPKGESKDLISMRQAIQSKHYDKAAKIAEALIDQGFVNIEAHAICSKAYEALKDRDKAKFHSDVTSSLIRSILSTGDGKTKQTAFEVIGTSEEYIVVQVLGLPVLGMQSLIQDKPHSYDLQQRTDPKTGEHIAVYFNIDAFFPPKGL